MFLYEIVLDDIVREVSVDSVISPGEGAGVKSASVMSIETAEFSVFPVLHYRFSSCDHLEKLDKV